MSRGSPFPRPGVLVLVAAALAGCGPAELLPAPEGWPAEWAGRRLFNTPLALIYASSEADAGEMDRALRAAAEEFHRQAGRPAPRGLVIASSPEDPLYAPDLLEIYLRASRTAAEMDSKPPDNPSSVRQEWERVSREMEQRGISPTVHAYSMVASWPPEEAAGILKLPDPNAWAIAFVVALPTSQTAKRALWQALGAMMKEEGAALAVLVAPLLALMEPKMAEGAAVARQIAVYQQFLCVQADWPHAKRRELLEAFKKKKERELLGILAPLGGGP